MNLRGEFMQVICLHLVQIPLKTVQLFQAGLEALLGAHGSHVFRHDLAYSILDLSVGISRGPLEWFHKAVHHFPADAVDPLFHP